MTFRPMLASMNNNATFVSCIMYRVFRKTCKSFHVQIFGQKH